MSALTVYDFAMSKATVISLGGSIVVPDQVDTDFVRSFVKRIAERIAAHPDWRVALVIGGGATARSYQKAAREAAESCPPDTLDRIGIASTRVNAEVVRAAFGDLCPEPVITDPTQPGNTAGPVLIAGGWKPGFSTDNVSVRLAESLGADTVINLSNIRQVYTADPKVDPDARPLTSITWKEFFTIAGDEWTPGKNTPFDPVATKRAAELGMKVVAADGRDLDNLECILDEREFFGTTIGPE